MKQRLLCKIYTLAYIYVRVYNINEEGGASMYIKQYLEDNGISIYKVANSAAVAYPTVFNIVNGKVDILNCAL